MQALATGQQGSSSTIGRQCSALRALLAFAVKSDLIPRTAWRSVRLPQATLTDRPQLDPEALARLDLRPMLWLGAVGGLRWAEVTGVTVGSLDLLRGAVTITHPLDR